MQQRQVATTADGSLTIAIPTMQVQYHSVHGAVQESDTVFIQAGLQPMLRQRAHIHLLEVGLGTGLNVLMTIQALQAHPAASISYTALEPHPLLPAEYGALSYAHSLSWPRANEYLSMLHQAPPDEWVQLHPQCRFRKLYTRLEDAPGLQNIHLIYYDAFAPRAQPHMWVAERFAQLFHFAAPQALLTSYCSKSVVQKAMKQAGWAVEKLPGPRGKREMLRAMKNA